MQKDDLKKGIFILPNLFTTMNLFCGYYAIVSAFHSEFVTGAVLILAGAFFDFLDGKIARVTKTTSKFGVEYDSLADLITFGTAPSLLTVFWILEPMGKLGWMAGFLFTACGALRLARFNTSNSQGPDFEGLPIPAAATTAVSCILISSRLDVNPEACRILILVLMIFLAFCMVSSFRYKSLKKVALFNRLTLRRMAMLTLIFAATITEPCIFVFVASLLYVLSGPFTSLVFHEQEQNTEQEQTAD